MFQQYTNTFQYTEPKRPRPRDGSRDDDRKKRRLKYNQDYPEGTPLIVACELGRLDDVKALIQPMNVNQFGRDSDGDGEWTPLMIAAWKEHFQIVKYLIEECNADPNIADSEGENVMHLVYSNKNTNIVEILINHMSFLAINKKSSARSTPLDYAYVSESPVKQAIIDLMKSKGALTSQQIDLVQIRGYTVLNSNMTVEELKEKYNNRLQIIKFYSDLNIEDHFFGNIDENNLSEIFANKQELLNSDNFLICSFTFTGLTYL